MRPTSDKPENKKLRVRPWENAIGGWNHTTMFDNINGIGTIIPPAKAVVFLVEYWCQSISTHSIEYKLPKRYCCRSNMNGGHYYEGSNTYDASYSQIFLHFEVLQFYLVLQKFSLEVLVDFAGEGNAV